MPLPPSPAPPPADRPTPNSFAGSADLRGFSQPLQTPSPPPDTCSASYNSCPDSPAHPRCPDAPSCSSATLELHPLSGPPPSNQIPVPSGLQVAQDQPR